MKDLTTQVHDLMSDVYKSLNDYDEVLLTNDEYDNDDDLIWELPRISTVSKHGFYIESVITKITKGGDLTCKGIGEDWGDVESFNVSDLSYGEAVNLLGFLNN